MNKKELMELMQFVIDSNANVLAEATSVLELTQQQQRTVLNAVESKTKDCFFRFVDRVEPKKKSTRSRK